MHRNRGVGCIAEESCYCCCFLRFVPRPLERIRRDSDDDDDYFQSNDSIFSKEE